MGTLQDKWYKAQALYLESVIKLIDLTKGVAMVRVWLNITKLGCVYTKKTEERCWEFCPPLLKDEHLGVFRLP